MGDQDYRIGNDEDSKGSKTTRHISVPPSPPGGRPAIASVSLRVLGEIDMDTVGARCRVLRLAECRASLVVLPPPGQRDQLPLRDAAVHPVLHLLRALLVALLVALLLLHRLLLVLLVDEVGSDAGRQVGGGAALDLEGGARRRKVEVEQRERADGAMGSWSWSNKDQ